MPDLSEAGRELRDWLNIAPAPVAELRRRSARRHRRKRAAIAVPLLCAGLATAIGVAVNANNQSQQVIVRGPAPSGVPVTTASSTSVVPTGQCTQADLHQPRVGGVPAPHRVTIATEIGQFELDPPASGTNPLISAQAAWAKVESYFTGGVGGGNLRILLGAYNGRFPTTTGPNGSQIPAWKGQLVWVIELQGAAYSSGRIVGGPNGTLPVCFFGDLYAIVNADTGELLLTG